MGTLVAVAQLAGWLDDPATRVFDCRFSLADDTAGRRLWQENHIPGARHADLNRDLSGPVVAGRTGRHPLPDIDVFLARLSTWGVSNASKVVVYDEASGAFAARMWWMLRWVGHDDVHLLDGGYQAWIDAGNPVDRETPGFPETSFIRKAPLTRTIEAADLSAFEGLLLDARDAARYRGENETIDPVAGHIPGAKSAPFADNLTPSQTFRTVPRLRDRFESIGITDQSAVACYCGSGVTAAHNVLALVHSGFPEPALYAGSWSEWITNPDRPVET